MISFHAFERNAAFVHSCLYVIIFVRALCKLSRLGCLSGIWEDVEIELGWRSNCWTNSAAPRSVNIATSVRWLRVAGEWLNPLCIFGLFRGAYRAS